MSISDIYRATLNSVGPISAPESKPVAGKGQAPSGPSEFQSILKEATAKETAEKKLSPLNFSQHAETRIRSRQIPWDAAMEKRIGEGIDAANAKGSREALILADNLAVIANVKSRTVITAIDRAQLKERIFTNIDSTVLV